MSGFVALLNLDGAPLDPPTQLAWLQRATAMMRFRGPDAQASRHEGEVGLGHTLLRTTFEAAKEQQPCTLDHAVWLVADARVDDRVGLIATLRSRGRTLDDDAPDPILILHAYAVWGEGCLEHLLGDFAFVLWDAPVRRLFCARDPAGVVPFFYARTADTLVISNTLNIIRSYPTVSSRLNDVAVTDFLLTNHNSEADSTIFAEIQRLPPAHKLVVNGQRMQALRYWQLPQEVEYIRYRRPQLYVEHFRSLFEQAVADRLRTDCAASALSGGLDSTSIAVTAARHLRAQNKPFDLRGATMAFSWLIQEEEGKYAQQVADFAGFPTKQYIYETYLNQTPDADPAYPEPEPWVISAQCADPTILQDTAKFARVYFMGFGGDPLLSRSRLPWRQALALGQYRSLAHDLRTWLRLYRRRSSTVATWMDDYLRIQRSFLSPLLTTRVDAVARQAHYAKLHSATDLRRGMLSAPLWETIFRVSDPGYTGLAVKIRYPFFDLRLLDYLLRVPPDPWCRNKYLLREAMRGLLPETVRSRPKTPLGRSPHYLIIEKQGVPAWMVQLAALPALHEYVDQEKLSESLAHPTEMNWQIAYRAITFANWLRQGKIM